MKDTSCALSIPSKFFFKRFVVEDFSISLSVECDDGHRDIVFEYVRSFIFFKESDMYMRTRNYNFEKLIGGDERSVGVFRIISSPILNSVVSEDLKEEDPSYFFVSSPDECLEVVAFSDPVLLSK